VRHNELIPQFDGDVRYRQGSLAGFTAASISVNGDADRGRQSPP
jgi:hypothetical protein